MLVDEERHVGAHGREPDVAQLAGEWLVPGSWCLLEPVQKFDEEANMVGMGVVDEAGRLEAIDPFSQLAMQECILDVELVDRPVAGCRQM
jgi:hypothetical protein